MHTPEDVREATIAGELEKVASHLDRCPGLVHSKDDDGHKRALIHWAAANGRCAIIELLLAKGADIQVADSIGSTPLHIAASCGEAKAVELLLQNGADANARTKLFGFTPLALAQKYDQRNVAEILRTWEGRRQKT
jgi:hypothetical protein